MDGISERRGNESASKFLIAMVSGGGLKFPSMGVIQKGLDNGLRIEVHTEFYSSRRYN